jgi:cation diffusion facilitator family transporter
VKQAQNLAVGSIAVGAVVLALKLAAWKITGSAALFSDAAETVVNVLAACVAWGALSFAARPADANHPYGHDKAEFFSAVIEGVLIVLASLLIVEQAWMSWRNPVPLEQGLLGLGLNAVSSVLNVGWASLLLRRGKSLRSPALVADGRHLMSDVVTSVGVLVGVGLVLATGLQWLDPAVAVVAALYVLVSGISVIKGSVSGLMDEAPAEEVMHRIRAVVAEQAQGAIEAHDLRTRQAGRQTFLEFHLVVPGAMTVKDAHAICDRIEAALKAEMEGLMITIHVEPEGKAKHHGVLVL